MKHLLAALAIVFAAPVSAGTFGPYSELLVFGDSLSDPGNIAAFSGNTNPDPRVYPNGQFTNGDTWAKQLGADVGTNFAYGGARASDNGDIIPDFAAQIDIFQAVAPSLGHNPLTAVWFGGNDLRDLSADILEASATIKNPFKLKLTIGALSAQSAIKTAASVANGVAELATQSGLKDFLVFLAPDISSIPALVNTQNESLFSGIVRAHNTAIKIFTTHAARLLPGVTVDFFDPNVVAARIFDDPAAFGLDPEKITAQCLSATSFCGLDNASEYYFFDDIHPTEGVHAEIAKAVRAQVVPLPGGLSLALSGLILLGFAARRKRAA